MTSVTDHGFPGHKAFRPVCQVFRDFQGSPERPPRHGDPRGNNQPGQPAISLNLYLEP